MSENDVLIAGFPKSGNSWLSRLLGDILNCPVTGWESAHPIAEEGTDRPGRYRVRQLHLQPVYTPMMPNFTAWEYSIPDANGEHIAIIFRNPLDVIVSAYHYWQMSNMNKAIDAVMLGQKPLERLGGIVNFYRKWEDVKIPVSYIRYEDLLDCPVSEIASLLARMNITDYDETRIHPAVERQSFANRKQELSQNGDKYSYGKDVQLRNLRHGRAGDWRTELTQEQVEFVKTILPKRIIELYDL